MDKKIIQNAQAGDTKSFETLVKKYLPAIYNFLRQMISDPNVLDDLSQETFIKAWKNLRKFNNQKNFKSWIFTIAKNTAYDYFKKKKTVPFSNFTDKDGYNFLENTIEEKIIPDDLLEKADKEKDFEKKVSQLPSIYRTLLNLKYREDFSLTEISKILKIPYNTIKSRHKRALLKLKKILEKS